jgi:preprotein translocase subunit SecB
MSDSSTIGAGGSGQAATPATPPLVLSTQYVREMNFRVPGAPAIYAIPNLRPHITLGIDVQARQAEDNHPTYEVTLLMSCTATTHAPAPDQDPPPVAFVVELAYSGIFMLQNVPADAIEPVLLAECPRLLFPFARAVLADITREAGFPPVMLQPFDFIAFWQNKRAATAAAAGANSGSGDALERALQPAT